MSQIYKPLGSPPPPGDGIMQITTQDGITLPVGGNVDVFGAPRPDPLVIPDDDNGIQTYSDPSGGQTASIFLTNRRVDTGSVTGAVTEDLFTQDLGGTPGTYNFQVYVAGYEDTTPAGCGYTTFGTVRTTGAAATVISIEDIIADEEAALLDADFELVVVGNDVIARVTGVAGLTINYKVLAQYIFIGA